MTISMIFFFVSFVGIIAMIWLKSFELRTNKKLLFALLAEKTDHRVHAMYHKGRTIFSYFNRKSAVALIQWIAYHILSRARSFYILVHRKAHAHPPSKKVIDMVRGKGESEKIEGTSFFLKRISEETKEIEK